MDLFGNIKLLKVKLGKPSFLFYIYAQKHYGKMGTHQKTH